MKDLKHLIFFEQQLQEVHNSSIRQAIAEGKKALGYTCYYIPEVLLNLSGCFSVRLRAPGIGTADVGTYYMTKPNRAPPMRGRLRSAICVKPRKHSAISRSMAMTAARNWRRPSRRPIMN